jgi:uncharacterized protein
VLREHRTVLVALSGGVDSAVLLAIACEALGSGNVLAVTGRSGSVTDQEVLDAQGVARTLRTRHEVVDTREIDRPGYKANGGDRCFHCRTELFEVLGRIARDRGIGAIAYGAIVDDLGDDRPGMAAAREMGILAPLLGANICKDDVRTLASEFNLHIHDKPANACLASRIPMGSEVTVERLTQVSRAEAALRELGFRQLRVRHHGDIARIEFGSGEARRLTDPRIRNDVIRSVKQAGFRFVAVDLEDYGTSRVGPDATGMRLYSIEPHRDSGQ